VRYLPGEGVLGMVLERGERLVLPRLADEPRFLDRLRLYDRELPLIGVPIRAGSGQYSGVLAAQPPRRDEWLPERARFLEMVANLIARSVRAAQAMGRERGALTAERDSLRRTVRGQHGFDSMVGHSQPMQQVFEQVRQVAKWNTTVLVRGESGTGKELIACAIHYNSPRASGPLVKLNCAALPDNLLESELFGHEKGAFTGAVNQRKGRFRTGARRHPVPGRDRRYFPGFSGQAVAGDAGRRDGAGRQQPDPTGGRSRSSPPPTAIWKRRWTKVCSGRISTIDST
jgi:Nif-specific regulatory protein